MSEAIEETPGTGEPQYKVVINDEGQYSIWPAPRENALGWRDEGTVGSREQCLAHIEAAWVDMLPRSLRRAMSQQG
jgi:MbtH protein